MTYRKKYIEALCRERCTMTYRIYQTLITLRSQCERSGNMWRLHDDRMAFYEMILHSYYTFHGAAMAIIAIPWVRFYCANLRLHVNEQFQQNSIKEIYNANKPSFYHNWRATESGATASLFADPGPVFTKLFRIRIKIRLGLKYFTMNFLKKIKKNLNIDCWYLIKYVLRTRLLGILSFLWNKR